VGNHRDIIRPTDSATVDTPARHSRFGDGAGTLRKDFFQLQLRGAIEKFLNGRTAGVDCLQGLVVFYFRPLNGK